MWAAETRQEKADEGQFLFQKRLSLSCICQPLGGRWQVAK